MAWHWGRNAELSWRWCSKTRQRTDNSREGKKHTQDPSLQVCMHMKEPQEHRHWLWTGSSLTHTALGHERVQALTFASTGVLTKTQLDLSERSSFHRLEVKKQRWEHNLYVQVSTEPASSLGKLLTGSASIHTGMHLEILPTASENDASSSAHKKLKQHRRKRKHSRLLRQAKEQEIGNVKSTA